MVSPVIGVMTAVWLMLAPAMEVETGARAYLAIAAGVVAFVLSPVGIWSRGARVALASVGFVLALANFFLPCSVGALASLATCGVTLIIAGIAPAPVVTTLGRAAPVVSVPGVIAREERITAPSRTVHAAA